jgi:hypothetical protein
LPLYRLLKKHERFSWTVEAQEALDKLKATLTHVPILTPPQNDEPLYLYVATTTQVVSVGDRPRGPLKQWGNPHLNPCFEIS